MIILIIYAILYRMTEVRVSAGPYLGELPSDYARSSSRDYIAKARESLQKVTKLPKISAGLEGQISALEKGEIPDFDTLTRVEDIVLKHQDNPNAVAAGQTARFIRQALSLQRFESQRAPIDFDAQRNFAQTLNKRIDPITKSGERTKLKDPGFDFKGVAVNMASLEQYLHAPFDLFDQGGFKGVLKPLIKESKFHLVADLVSSYLHDAVRALLTPIISIYQKDDSLDLMTIFGGLSNALSIHLALAKVALDKVSAEFNVGSDGFKARLGEVFDNLPHISKQFSKLQAKTLKLIENQNNVISNQLEPYNFNPENFEVINSQDGKLLLLPIVKFLEKVIKLANDNDTVVNSKGLAPDGITTATISTNFAETYTKPQGCPFSDKASSNDSASLSVTYFEKLKKITREIFGLDEIN